MSDLILIITQLIKGSIVVLVEHTNYIKGKTMQKLIFFGDSICTGQYISIHKGWVSRLSESLYGQLVVLNSSVNGRTTLVPCSISIRRTSFPLPSVSSISVALPIITRSGTCLWQPALSLAFCRLSSFWSFSDTL